MSPLALALAYLEVFYTGHDLEALDTLFARDLVFEGPFFAFDSAEAYIASLRDDPPQGMTYTLIDTFENASSACVFYHFTKGEVRTPMAQWFEVKGEVITRIRLIFDTAAFLEEYRRIGG